MKIIEIIVIGFILAIDAFCVSVCKGMSINNISKKESIIISGYFGIFQAIMPLIGYFFGTLLKNIIIDYDHWISFILLFIIGLNMIIDDDETKINNSLEIKDMILLSVATSIDALMIGFTFIFNNVSIYLSIIIIGIITFIVCYIGTKIGNILSNRFEEISKKIGGVVLIILGVKIVIEHIFLS